ncbi:hypothetical protein GINT2_000915 [Glugoides intestinalis]
MGYTGQRRKQPSRRSTIGNLANESSKRNQIITPEMYQCYAVPKEFTSKPPFDKYNQNTLISANTQHYKEATRCKEYRNSDIEFLLTTSSEQGRQIRNVNNPAILEQIFDRKESLENRIKEKDGKKLDEFLMRTDLKETLYDLPYYFFAMKCEYENLKSKYENILTDLAEQKKVCEELANRGKQLTEESATKSESLLNIKSENETLRNKQKVLDSYKDEKDRLLDILKKSLDSKAQEIEELVRENGEIKCANSKLQTSKDLLEREYREKQGDFTKLVSQKNVLKTEIENVKKVVEVTLERHLNSGLYVEIERISKENKRLVFYESYYKCFKSLVSTLKQNMVGFQTSIFNSKSKATLLIEEVIKLLYKEQTTRKGISVKTVELMEHSSLIKKSILDVFHSSQDLEKLFSVESIKKEFAKAISNQKNEFEMQRRGYERKIKELTEKLEDHEDVWTVFK